MAWHRRLVKDIADLREGNFQIIADDGTENLKMDCFRILLKGPPDTPYATGSWHVRFTFATTYPFTSPSVGFVQHILHPNIDWNSGSVCLDALNKKWSPVFTLKHIMETLLPYLLAYPNAQDPLNRDAAALLASSPSAFAASALDATRKFALAQ